MREKLLWYAGYAILVFRLCRFIFTMELIKKVLYLPNGLEHNTSFTLLHKIWHHRNEIGVSDQNAH